MKSLCLIARTSDRLRFAAVALLSFALISGGLILQKIEHIDPCPMCIMQRYAFVIAGILALIAALHNRGSKIYATLLGLTSLVGLGIAARQSWLQWFPPKLAECGPDLDYMLNSFPLGRALPMIFQGSGDCSIVDWTFLGLSIANYSALAFTAVTVVAVSILLRGRCCCCR
ncbi:disulfide bond formation protein B [Niveibacterium terrae]|uniref:disulfide bond formation protein B n=1 Tax=Niveibacterium terrae TaxID=3373598 RepID=UPI003A948E25